MRIKVMYYGILKSLSGTTEAELEIEGPEPSVRELVAKVATQVGVLATQLDAIASAVDRELVPRSHRLREGDVVMLLPPVSGG